MSQKPSGCDYDGSQQMHPGVVLRGEHKTDAFKSITNAFKAIQQAEWRWFFGHGIWCLLVKTFRISGRRIPIRQQIQFPRFGTDHQPMYRHAVG